MKLQVVTSESEFKALERDWRLLSLNHPSLSVFSSFDFIWLSWSYFKKEGDSLHLLVFREADRVVAILPLMLENTSYRGIPCRELRHIGSREGDRPGLITAIEPELIWRAAFSYLEERKQRWQVLRLDNLEAQWGPLTGFPWTGDSRFSCFIEPDAESYYAALDRDFEHYLDSLNRSARQNFRRRVRRAKEQLPDFHFEELAGEELLEGGLDRFADLERRSWKGGAPEAFSSDPARWSFYRSFCGALSSNGGMPKLIFLRANGTDIAANLLFQFGDRLYARQRVYDPLYADASPGILNNLEVIRRHCDCGLKEYDMLSTPLDQGIPHHKADWATGKRATVKVIAIVNRSRLFPLAAMKRVHAKVQRLQRMDPSGFPHPPPRDAPDDAFGVPLHR